MGEEPDRVHVTGCPGIDMVMATPTLARDETFAAVGLAKPVKAILALLHPNTLGDTASELEALSVALARRGGALVLLGPNADAGGDLIRREWQRLAANRPDTVYHDNVPPQVFYSLLKWCDVLVGNSSAGFYEAPCFGTKILNLGDRQSGRIRPYNVRQENHFDADVISSHIDVAMGKDTCVGGLVDRPYGDGHAAERIAKVIGDIKDPKALLRKRFQDCTCDHWNCIVISFIAAELTPSSVVGCAVIYITANNVG
jgi:UDP-N-acetylglucosamine 2-epimerase